MELFCKACGKLISEDHYSIHTRIAHCPHCDAVFEFNLVNAEDKIPQNALSVPKTLEFTTTSTGAKMAYRWLNWRSPLFMAAGLTVIGIPIMLFNVVGGENQTINPLIVLISVPIMLFGLWLIYYSLALFINRTHIVLDADQLSIVHRPILLRKAIRLNLKDVETLYIQEVQFGNAYSPSVIYDVYAQMQTGAELRLLKGLADKAQVDFILHQLKSYLVIRQARANDLSRNLEV